MSMMALTEPTTTDTLEPEEVHYYCCSVRLALCGISLDDSYLETDEDNNNNICKLCEIVINVIGANVICTDRCKFVRL